MELFHAYIPLCSLRIRKSTPITTWITTSVFFIGSSIPLYGYILSVPSPINGHLCRFQGLAIVNTAVRNIHVHLLCGHIV